MARASIAFPDDLKERIDRYLSEQEAPPSLSTLVQAAVKEYLDHRALYERGYRPPSGPLDTTPLEDLDDEGPADVSVRHDDYLAEEWFEERERRSEDERRS